MPRVSAIWKEKIRRRHEWKVDEMVGGIQRRITRAFVLSFPYSMHGKCWNLAGRKKKGSQGLSESSGWCRRYVVSCVWKVA